MVFSTHKSTLIVAVIAASLGLFAPAVESTDATMYWDCCKPSGAWPGKAAVYNPVVTCQADGKTIVTGPRRDEPNSSGCAGGFEFQCSCQQPWTDALNPEIGYGFAAMTSATEHDNECACYVAEFQSPKPGKVGTLFYQVINDGGDVTQDGLDILVPGMGMGLMTQGCPAQWKGSDMSKWGAQYGGLNHDAAGCANLPGDLQHGCKWRMRDWGDSITFKGRPTRVKCSKAHIDRTGCQRKDDAKVDATFDTYLKGRKWDSTSNCDAPDGYKPNPAVCGIGGSSRSTGHAFIRRGGNYNRH
ncbi:related to Endoglucanase 1 precursor [Ustilago trichophora]|uniref:cellulase n=1 Tax=Ustilago trichophora TaxID=86804 RepID=A0A5C3E8U5_9BASI|nr:related to Endoglucanase 1 precursor [Ustilago trichophora]